MTKKQYDNKIKTMSIYDHWDQIDYNVKKFSL